MKKLIQAFTILLLLAGCKTNVEEPVMTSPEDLNPFSAGQIDAHNSRNSLDWEGSYSGVLPCEDCIGIDTHLKITRENTYTITQRTVHSGDVPSEEFKGEGSIFWNEEGSAITLEDFPGEISTFRVGELFLTPLNKNGIEVKPELGNNFKLLKQ